MVKKDSDGKMETKPKFEPIDYEEELDFSLQTPTEKTAPNRESLAEAHLTKIVKEKVKDDPEAAAESTENKGEDAEHKVSVMVHRSQQETKVKAQSADQAAPPQPKPLPEVSAPPPDRVDASSKSPERKNSLVTVIKLGPAESQQQQKPTEQRKSNEEAISVKKEDQAQQQQQQQQQQVTFKIPAASSSSSSNSKFPLLPPPPPSTSTKMRAGYTQILRPTPASPPVPVRNAAVAKSDKSMSLPRGLPSDFGDFDDGDEDAGSGASGRAASLNPFQVDDAILKEEAEKKKKLLEMRAAKGLFNLMN